MRKFVTALCLGCLVACQTVNDPAPIVAGRPAAAPVGNGQVVDVVVQAAGSWQHSGVLLLAGDSYRLTASGRWSMGPFCGLIQADAAGNNPLCAGDPEGLGAPGGSLLGRVGFNGPPFAIGNGRVIKPSVDGELFMRSYDWLPGDNTGAISVRVGADGEASEARTQPPRHDPL